VVLDGQAQEVRAVMHDGHGMGWGGWFVALAMMVVFWGALAWVVVSLIRSNGTRSHAAPTGMEATRILDERFARGEIDEAEYQRRRDLLRGGA
jgi:putative membrane protein